MENTRREIEIQEMVCEILQLIEQKHNEHTDKLQSYAEKAYYVGNLIAKLDIIMSMRMSVRD